MKKMIYVLFLLCTSSAFATNAASFNDDEKRIAERVESMGIKVIAMDIMQDLVDIVSADADNISEMMWDALMNATNPPDHIYPSERVYYSGTITLENGSVLNCDRVEISRQHTKDQVVVETRLLECAF